MYSDARIQLCGTITAQPVQKKVGEESNVTSFPVSVSTGKRDESGAFSQNMYSVSVWGKTGEYLASRLQEGMLVDVAGDLRFEPTLSSAKELTIDARVTAFDVKIRARNKRERAPEA